MIDYIVGADGIYAITSTGTKSNLLHLSFEQDTISQCPLARKYEELYRDAFGLKEINLKNGNVGESCRLDRHYFPTKIQVYDGYVYYLFLDSRKQNGDKRSLYRLKIN